MSALEAIKVRLSTATEATGAAEQDRRWQAQHLKTLAVTNSQADVPRLVSALEAVEALADRWEQTPALRKGPAAQELRTAIRTALEGTR
ncbi:hypothetical protein GCM10023081_47030 [Arthrobacter ginkgonis]|uniref:Uncharacterized protein n=1 Tax=Arthrobacter ginkgonis TaxID=1630594 RepID=A0ABP7DHG1_9MICC